MQWEFCPRAYKYIYIDGMRITPSVPMQLGSSFHDFAKLLIQSLNYNLLYEVESKNQVRNILTEASMRIEAPSGLQNPIENFLTFETDRFWSLHENPDLYDDPVKYYTPVFAEEYMKVDGVFQDVTLSGILDRGDLTANKGIALIEYKLSQKLNAQRLQKELMFYSILYEEANLYEYPVTDLVAYTPVTNDYVWIEMDHKKQDTVRKRIQMMIDDTEFICKESIFCSGCVGADICLNMELDPGVIVEFLSESDLAYSTTEVAKAVNIRRNLVKATLSDLYIAGKVKKSMKGRTAYWWVG